MSLTPGGVKVAVAKNGLQFLNLAGTIIKKCFDHHPREFFVSHHALENARQFEFRGCLRGRVGGTGYNPFF